MSLALIIPDRKITRLIDNLRSQAPDIPLQIWPDIGNLDDVLMTLVWKHPPASLNGFKNLALIQSFGAGVDHILSDPDLPHVDIARIVDPDLAVKMGRYLVGVVQRQVQRFDEYRQHQAQAQWQPRSSLKWRAIGILGLGQLGQEAAAMFNALGYQVHGWSRALKTLPGVISYQGESGLDEMLEQVDVVINLLPLTKETTGILDSSFFAKMKKGGYLINVARGQHLVDADLIRALDEEQLSGATLDVFSQEPLLQDHVFWTHEKVCITPHVSAVTSLDTVVTQVIENYRRCVNSEGKLNLIVRERGY